MSDLASIKNFIIDMDGVLWKGDQALPGLRSFFETLWRYRFKFCLATNNSTLTPEDYVAKLQRMGVTQVAPSQVITSSTATAQYLTRLAPAGTRVATLGEPALETALHAAGFQMDQDNPEYIIVGMDHALTWEKLERAALQIRAGAIWLGTNPDPNIPSERGILPETGAILAALQTAAGVVPQVIGKPEPIMYQMALRRMGASLETTAAIGDRLDTDILGAARAGIASILMLTGIATRQEAAASAVPPTWTFADLPALVQAMAVAQ